MNWLARLKVPYEVAAREGLSDVYQWHRALWMAFPETPDAERDFLSRVERKEREYLIYLLAARHPERPAWCPLGNWEVIKVKPAFLAHEYYRFDLLANPTRRVAKIGPDGERTKNGRRLALLQPDDQVKWLQHKAEKGGFSILDYPPLQLSKAQRMGFIRNGRRGCHFGVVFQGMLQVTDRGRFRQSFRYGIGSAKSFGFGMLMLHPTDY